MQLPSADGTVAAAVPPSVATAPVAPVATSLARADATSGPAARRRRVPDFDDAGRSGASPALRHEAEIDRWLVDGLRWADAVDDPALRRRAQMSHLLAAHRRLLGLMPGGDTDASSLLRERQLALLRHGTRRWLSLLKRVRYEHRARVARRSFRYEDCGVAPFRDADHGGVDVLDVLDRPEAFADVAPFVDAGVSHRARAAASLRLLQPRRLEAADLWSPGEAPLLGQWGLFAAVDLPAGTCLGVYGGQLLDDVDIFLLIDDRYLMSASEPVGRLAVNGENLMSLMNTLFVLDADGAVAGHPRDGYNVRGETFSVRLRHGWTARLQAFRASEDIPAGRELRWNYDLGGAPA